MGDPAGPFEAMRAAIRAAPNDRERARHLFDWSAGKGWGPPDPRNPLIVRLIEKGYLVRADGRCGFERMANSHVAWTDAAQLAFTALKALPSLEAMRKVVDG